MTDEPPQDQVWLSTPRELTLDEFADWLKIEQVGGRQLYDPNKPGQERDDDRGDTAGEITAIPPKT